MGSAASVESGHKDIKCMTSQEVGSFIIGLSASLAHFEKVILEENVTGLDLSNLATEDDLKLYLCELGIEKLVHQNKILVQLRHHFGMFSEPIGKPIITNNTNKTMVNLLQQQGIYSPDTETLKYMVLNFGAAVNIWIAENNGAEIKELYITSARRIKTNTLRGIQGAIPGFALDGLVSGAPAGFRAAFEGLTPKVVKPVERQDDLDRLALFPPGGFCHENICDHKIIRSAGKSYAVSTHYPSTLECRPTIDNSNDVDRIITDISSALQFLHSLGFCHFDVKPDNIGLWAGGCYLIDLESVTAFDEISDACTTAYLPTNCHHKRGNSYLSCKEHDFWMLALTVLRKVVPHNDSREIKTYSRTEVINVLRDINTANLHLASLEELISKLNA